MNLKEKLNNRGITLIALVITIVLLILAGVSIAMLTGENGILTQAQNAKESTENAGEEEKIKLAAMAAIGESLGGDIEQGHLEEELDNYFGSDGYEITPGENNGEDGFIVTIDESGNQYFVDKDGNVSQMVAGPSVTHTISPEGQVAEGDKITITITATATEGSITEIIKPDGSSVKNVTETTYEVTENGDYKFIVKQSNGGTTTHTVTITTGIEVEKFSDIYTETKEYTKDGQTAWIPEGFAVGVSSKIDDISEGLVITDKIDENHKSIGNEFVWIPVATAVSDTEADGTTNKAMAIQQEDGNYRGLLYNFDADGSEVQSKCTTTTSSYREPDILTSYDNSTSNNNGLFTKESLQSEYNKMIESVKIYHGFYVGRYELGLDGSNNPTSKKDGNGVETADAGSSSLGNWYGLYSKSKEYAKESDNKSTVSSMLWGNQYDAMLNWMQENGENVYQSNSSKTNDSYDTGSEENDFTKNVFDLYGCHYEWTLEAYDSGYRVFRGGSGSNIYAPSNRDYRDPIIHYSNKSTRLTLYVALDTE